MPNGSKHNIWGIILIALGIIFLFNFNLGSILRVLWPLAIIAIGLYVIFKHKHGTGSSAWSSAGQNDQSGIPGLFGEIKMANLTEGIGSIEKTLLFGDIEIDLTGAKLLDGDNYISAMALFGSIKINLPENYPTKVDLGCCGGDLYFRQRHADGLFVGLKTKDETYDNASARLNINGKLVFGEIKVTSKSK
jgi:predicted membrane protein